MIIMHKWFQSMSDSLISRSSQVGYRPFAHPLQWTIPCKYTSSFLSLTELILTKQWQRLEDPFPHQPVSKYCWASFGCRQGTENRSSETHHGCQWQYPRSVSYAIATVYWADNTNTWLYKGDLNVCQHAWCAFRWIPFWRCSPWWREQWISTMYERKILWSQLFVCYIKHMLLLFPSFILLCTIFAAYCDPLFRLAFYIYIVCVYQDGAR